MRKADVEFHSDYGREARPAVNVKVYSSPLDAFPQFVREEDPDPRFTPEWVEANVSEERLDAVFWHVCEAEFEYLKDWAEGTEGDSLFPDDRVQVWREGRMGGWAVVDGLPDLEEWDVVRLSRWARFARIAREIADGVPFQVLASLYLNEFEAWSEEESERLGAEAFAPEALAAAAGGAR